MFSNLEYTQVYIPSQFFLRYNDAGWMNEARQTFRSVGTAACTLRDLEDLDGGYKQVYVNLEEYEQPKYKISLYLWMHQLLWAEAQIPDSCHTGMTWYERMLRRNLFENPGRRWRHFSGGQAEGGALEAPAADCAPGAQPAPTGSLCDSASSSQEHEAAPDGHNDKDKGSDKRINPEKTKESAFKRQAQREMDEQHALSMERPIPYVAGTDAKLEKIPENFKQGATIKGRGELETIFEKVERIAKQQAYIHRIDADTCRKAVCTGPTTDRTLFNPSVGNMVDSIDRRVMVKGAREVDLTRNEQIEVEKLVGAYVKKLEALGVGQALVDKGGIEGCKPHGWQTSRWQEVLDTLGEHATTSPFELNIKAEAGMPATAEDEDDKPARAISNEKEVWQALSSPIFKVLEELDCKLHGTRNIKHKTKTQLHYMMFKQSRKVVGMNAKVRSSVPLGAGSVFIEGDGSKWDACCGDWVHKTIEAPIVKMIIDTVMHACYELPPKLRAKSRDRRLNSKKPVLRMPIKDIPHYGFTRDLFAIVLREIIRSTGDSGTSYLNRIVNKLLWCHVLCAHSEQIVKNLGDEVIHYCCRYTKKSRRMCAWFEGDDSALILALNIMDHKDEIEAHWRRLGFNMKLKFIESSRVSGLGEFCGHHYWIENGGLAGTAAAPVVMPDINRGLNARGRSNCSEALENEWIRNGVGYHANAARAASGKDSGVLGNECIASANQYLQAGIATHKNTKINKDIKMIAGMKLEDSTAAEEVNMSDYALDALATSAYYGDKRFRDAEVLSMRTTASARATASGMPGLTHHVSPREAAAFGLGTGPYLSGLTRW